MTVTRDDEALMGRALALAERGRGTVRPNPLVGCVLAVEGRVVGEGWHERAGGPHAEVVALRQAGGNARGSTAYVTLEPCAHQGRTGPCTRALIEAGVTRVVYALHDPDPQARGGAAVLASAGIEVRGDVRADEARAQNEVFLHRVTTGRPFVTLKLAQSLDGRVAAQDGSNRWITSPEARTAVHRLRAESDAVLVGSGTVLADDPELSVRHLPSPGPQPRPVVVDARGRTPLTARVLQRDALVVTTPAAPEEWRRALGLRPVDVVIVPAGAFGGVDLGAALRSLAAREVSAVLVEGGPTLAAALVREGLVDRLVLHVAPILLGGDGLPSLSAPGARTLGEAWRWQTTEVRRLGPDVELVARPTPASGAGRAGAASGAGRAGAASGAGQAGPHRAG